MFTLRIIFIGIATTLRNIRGSFFGHDFVVVLERLEFILLVSGSKVEGAKRKHLWGLVLLPPLQSRGWRNPWHRPSGEVAGVLTAQLPPRRRLKPFHSFLPPSLDSSSTEHMLFKNIWLATKLLPTIKTLTMLTLDPQLA